MEVEIWSVLAGLQCSEQNQPLCPSMMAKCRAVLSCMSGWYKSAPKICLFLQLPFNFHINRHTFFLITKIVYNSKSREEKDKELTISDQPSNGVDVVEKGRMVQRILRLVVVAQRHPRPVQLALSHRSSHNFRLLVHILQSATLKCTANNNMDIIIGATENLGFH